MAGDVIGGRAPAIQGQALTGVRRSQIGATSQEVQDNAAKQAALGSTYNEALNLAYENAAGSSRQKAADRSKMMATIRGTGA
jgi:hypothetical protein